MTVIVGYYGKCNLGDEIFQHYLSRLLRADTCPFERLSNCSHQDVIVMGGGDLFNPFFLEYYERYVAKYGAPIKLVAIGCGLAYAADAADWNRHLHAALLRH